MLSRRIKLKFKFSMMNLSSSPHDSLVSKDHVKFDHENGELESNLELDTRKKYNSHKRELNKFLTSSKERSRLKSSIPEECLIKKKETDYLYLIDPTVAEKVAKQILPHLIPYDNDHVIAECYPGLGLISKVLLENNIPFLRLYEPSSEFRDYLKKLRNKYPDKVKLFSKDLCKIDSYSYIDNQDNGRRVEELLENIPKKSWNSDPCMSIIGTNANIHFIRHLSRALAMQTSLATYGRVELFLIMNPRHYLALTAEVPLNMKHYTYMSVIFNLFFDYGLMDKLPRKAFLPWERKVTSNKKSQLRKIDEDKLYLAHISFKKDLPLPLNQLVPFYFFVKQLFGGKKKIIPTIEKWVPDCGENIIWPKLRHEDYYEDMSILTEFRDLTPNQIVEVFKEMYSHPSYENSVFVGMVESELNSETVESKSISISPDLEENIMEEIKITLENS